MASIKQKVILKLKDGDDFIQTLGDLLGQTGKVKITGLGVFEIKHINAREGYGVFEKKMIKIKAHNKLVFRPSVSLRKTIQKYGK